ncbi:MAG TPA: type IV pilus biogenesis/stability protein PilW [Steroidobacteraceae bacterium]|nr:type IV pilus biogenesis/stability protein PilW [Steroidobacteraceae bacterium]
MSARPLAVVIALLALAGCTTTTTSPNSPAVRQTSPTEAATFNSQLAIEYLKKGDLAVARDKVERALSQDPDNVSVQMTAALVYDRLGEDKKADDHYATALRLKPDDPEMQNNYGVYLCRKGKTDQGEKMLLKAANNAVYKTPEVAITNAGMCMRGVKRMDEAERYFRQALAIRPRFGDALLQLADLDFQKGTKPSYDEASGLIKRFLAVVAAPGPEILWLGVRVERARGDKATADAYARRLKNEYPQADQTRALIASER